MALSPDPTPPLERGEYGALLCPLDHVESNVHTLNDPDDDAYVPTLPAGPPWIEERIYDRRPCRSPLHVVWSGICGVDAFEHGPPTDLFETDENGHGWANCTSWRVECQDGHVLALSSEEENAEPFHPSILRGWTPPPEETP